MYLLEGHLIQGCRPSFIFVFFLLFSSSSSLSFPFSLLSLSLTLPPSLLLFLPLPHSPSPSCPSFLSLTLPPSHRAHVKSYPPVKQSFSLSTTLLTLSKSLLSL